MTEPKACHQHDSTAMLELPRPDLELDKPFVCSEGKVGKAVSFTGISGNLNLGFPKPNTEPPPSEPQVQLPRRPTTLLMAKTLVASELVPPIKNFREAWNILESDEKPILSSLHDVVAGETTSISPKPLLQMPRHAEVNAPQAMRPHQMRRNMLPHLEAKQYPDPLAEVLDWLGHADLDQRFKNELSPDRKAKVVSLEDGRRSRNLHRGFTTESNDSAEADGAAPARAQAPRSRVPKVVPPSGHQNLDAQCLQPTPCCDGAKHADPTPADRMDKRLEEEDEEWLHRQQRTGTVGRLAMYASNQDPSQDIVLRGGMDHPIVVAAVRDCGPAASAGVKAGDRLVSINGKKDFGGRSAEAVRSLIHPPVMLVFVGFVGKLQAEVRLSSTDQTCGLSLRNEVVTTGLVDAPFQVAEEKVFKPGLASLFLVVDPDEPCTKIPPQSAPLADPIFELRHCEAAKLLLQARAAPLRKLSSENTGASMARAAQLRQLSSQSTGASIVVDKCRQIVPDKPDGDNGLVEDGTQGQVQEGAPDDRHLGDEVSRPSLSRRPMTPMTPIMTPITPRLTPREGPLGSPRSDTRELARVPMVSQKAKKAWPCLDRVELCVDQCMA